MRKIVTSVVVASIGLSLPAIAHADEPYYYNRAGITRESYMADANECAELAGGVSVQTPYTYAPNMYAAAATAFFSGLMKSSERRRLQNKVERTCMADKGYRRLSIGKDQASALKALDEKSRLDRLFELAASTSPLGTELPE